MYYSCAISVSATDADSMKYPFKVLGLAGLFTALLLAVGCNKVDERIELVVASEQGYKLDDKGLPQKMFIARENSEGSEWKVRDLRNTKILKYENGYEYTVMSYAETYEPNAFPQFREKFWWVLDEVVEKVEKRSELPEKLYIFTYDSPWGFDPRDPMLTYLLNHYKEVFGSDFEIYYPTKD